MVLIKEYRIPLPFTLDEYRRGQLYMIAKASKEETNGSEGIEVLANESFDGERGKGIYTHKIIHLTSRLPSWTRKIFPFIGHALQIEEKSWNTFPYSRTEYKCSLFGDRCSVIVESIHTDDDGKTENIHNIPEDVLGLREVEYLDIYEDTNDHTTIELEDVKTFYSKKINRGPLDENWFNKRPVIYAYKLVYVEFNIRGLRKKVEHVIADMMSKIYIRTHRQAYVWMDEWIDLTLEEIKKIEDETHQKINDTLKNHSQKQSYLNSKSQKSSSNQQSHPKKEADQNDDDKNLRHPQTGTWKSRRRSFVGKLMSKL